MRQLAIIVLTLLTAVSAVGAPMDFVPERGGLTHSMGIPSFYRFPIGIETQWDRPGDTNDLALYGNLGIFRSIGHPVAGVLGLGLEGYGGMRATSLDGGGRAYLQIPTFQVAAGVDYNFDAESLDLLLRYDLPVRRGGVVGRGSALTFRWLPGRDHTFSVALTAPLGNRSAGKTRPKRDSVLMLRRHPKRLEPDSLEPELVRTLDVLRERAGWIARLTQPIDELGHSDPHVSIPPLAAELRAHITAVDPLFPTGHSLPEEIRVYHETLDLAFSIATGHDSAEGRAISSRARRILLDDVLYPYNSFLGQRRDNDSLTGLIGVAQSEFARWLRTQGDATDRRAITAFYVFQTLCDIMEENRVELRVRWEDSRLVWLPLQYGLKPEQHDTQGELNRILADATGEEFAPGNRIWYVQNELFQFEMFRSVRLAQDYHVLWIHDVSGVNHAGEPDRLAYAQVKNYIQVLTDRVRAYDETGVLTQFFIFLDQHFFETNKSRLWMRLLQDPLRHELKLPPGFQTEQDEIARLQAGLREAVDNSLQLRIERSQFGESWLRNRIKIHVSITNPVDPSYLSYRVMGKLPIPDNNMRDHRKIIFYDITEDDPYRGMAMFTGMGIGEHYIGANWEDRAVMMQGPGALATKTAARRLLEVQGFEPEQIPNPLRARPLAADYEVRIQAELGKLPAWLQDPLAVLQLHNETGFESKPINVAKAVLYSLMPSGSVLMVPDSLWQSYLYASLLSGSALNGCKSLVVAPTLASAPSAGAPQMARAHGLLGRVITFGNELDDVIAAEGGVLKVGLYAPRQGVGDIAGRIEQAIQSVEPWARRVYPGNPSVRSVAEGVTEQLESLDYSIEYLTGADSLATPKLHLKSNFFASGVAWQEILSHPGLGAVLREYIAYLAEQGAITDDPATMPDVRAIPDRLREKFREVLRGILEGKTDVEKQELVAFLTGGSTNMDYRSMVMNGEVMVTIAGLPSIVGLMDFLLLAGLCDWMDSTEELDALLPPPGGMTRRVSSFIKLGL